MKIIHTEKEIQNAIYKKKYLYEIVDDLPDIKKIDYKNDLSNLTPENIIINIINKRIKKIYSKIKSVELIGEEISLSKENESTIRTDLVGIPEGTNGICIIELKKSATSEWESFTQLLAYSNHFIDIFPTLTKDDLLLCLIAPFENRIVKEAYLNSLLFDKKPVLVLIPYFINENVDSIRLKPWIPKSNDLAKLSNKTFLHKNFSVFKVVWEDIPGYWNPESSKDEPCNEMKEQMNQVSSVAAQLMEEKGIHGFVFCSQLWPELKEALPYTNSIILVGLNPFALAGNDKDIQNKHPNGESEDYLSLDHLLSDFIPSLKKNETPGDYHEDRFEFLHSCWKENLSTIGFELVKFSLKNHLGKKHSLDYGSFTWKQYQEQMLEYVTCTNYNLRTTGMIRDIFFETLDADYNFTPANHPTLGDYFAYTINSTKSHIMFFDFLNRMAFS